MTDGRGFVECSLYHHKAMSRTKVFLQSNDAVAAAEVRCPSALAKVGRIPCPGDKNPMEYGRDAQAPILDRIEGLVLAMRNGFFDPDKSCSGRWKDCCSLEEALSIIAKSRPEHSAPSQSSECKRDVENAPSEASGDEDSSSLSIETEARDEDSRLADVAGTLVGCDIEVQRFNGGQQMFRHFMHTFVHIYMVHIKMAVLSNPGTYGTRQYSSWCPFMHRSKEPESKNPKIPNSQNPRFLF